MADLSAPGDAQAAAVAEIVQRVRPDVLLINELDCVEGGQALELFQRDYLSVSQAGGEPIEYRHRHVAPSNTGIPSGEDLDDNGSVGGGNDAFGFGAFPCQFGMGILSRYPIRDYVRPARSRDVYDDEGGRGGLRPGAAFVIAGDQNSDPLDGDSVPGAIQQLLEHPLVEDRMPESPEATEQARCIRRLLAARGGPPVPPGRGLPLPQLGPPPGLGRPAGMSRGSTTRP